MRRASRIIAVAAILSAAQISGRAHGLCVGTTVDEDIGRARLIFAGTVAQATPEKIPGTIVTRYRFVNVVYAKGSGPTDSLTLTSEGGTVGREGLWSEEAKHFEQGKRYITLATDAYTHTNWAKGYEPLMCAAGPFLVEADSGAGTPVVQATSGRPLIAFHDRFIVIRDSRYWAPDSSVVDLDAAGHVVPQQPPDLTPWTWARRDTTIPWWEQEARAKAAAAGVPPRDPVRIEGIWRQRDPGTRVSEEEFLDQIRAIVREQAEAKSHDTKVRSGKASGAGPPSAEPTPPQPPVRERAVPGAK